MKLTIISAMSQNRVIGINNTLPWHLKADLQHFKALTIGKTILMGKNTFLSIGKPLPNRRNIVLTREKFDQVETIQSPQELFHLIENPNEELMIIGGAQIYQLFLPYAEKIYLTLVKTEMAGDAFFPELNADWQLTQQEDHLADEHNQYDFSFLTYVRSTGIALPISSIAT